MTRFAQISVFLFALGSGVVWTQTCNDFLLQCKRSSVPRAGDMCSNFETWIQCVSGNGSQCQVEETDGVTFEQVEQMSRDSCPAFSPPLMVSEPCDQLLHCINDNTKIYKTINQEQYIMDTAKTGYWCSSFDGMMTCAIENAATCDIADSRVQTIQQKRENARNVCQGGGAAGITQQGTLATVLVVWAAALILPLIFA